MSKSVVHVNVDFSEMDIFEFEVDEFIQRERLDHVELWKEGFGDDQAQVDVAEFTPDVAQEGAGIVGGSSESSVCAQANAENKDQRASGDTEMPSGILENMRSEAEAPKKKRKQTIAQKVKSLQAYKKSFMLELSALQNQLHERDHLTFVLRGLVKTNQDEIIRLRKVAPTLKFVDYN